MRLQDVADRLDTVYQRVKQLPDSADRASIIMGLDLAYQTLVDVSSDLLATLDALSEQGRQLREDVEGL